MQIDPSKLPDNIKYSVIAAMVAAFVAVLLSLQRGHVPNTLLAAAYGAAIYLTVYTKLTTDVSTAKTAALVCAGLAGVFLLDALIFQDPAFLVINLIAGCGLGYAFKQLQELEKKASATPEPGAPSASS